MCYNWSVHAGWKNPILQAKTNRRRVLMWAWARPQSGRQFLTWSQKPWCPVALKQGPVHQEGRRQPAVFRGRRLSTSAAAHGRRSAGKGPCSGRSPASGPVPAASAGGGAAAGSRVRAAPCPRLRPRAAAAGRGVPGPTHPAAAAALQVPWGGAVRAGPSPLPARRGRLRPRWS